MIYVASTVKDNEAFVESNVILPNPINIFDGSTMTETSSFATDRTYLHFAEMSLPIFKTPALNLGSLSTVYAKDKKTYAIYNVFKTKDSGHIFSPLEKVGISIRQLTLGICTDGSQQLYVASNLLSTLNRYPATLHVQLYMYLYSICHFMYKMSQIPATSRIVQPMNPAVGMSRETLGLFTKSLYSFDKDINTTMVDLAAGIEIEGFRFNNDMLIGNLKIPSSSYVQYQGLLAKNDVGETFLLLVTADILSLVFNLTKHSVYTRTDILVADLDGNSELVTFGNAFATGTRVVHVNDFTSIAKGLAPMSREDASLEEDQIIGEIVKSVNGLSFTDECSVFIKAAGALFADTKKLVLPTLRDTYATDTYAQQLYKQAQSYYDTFNLGDLSKILTGFTKGDVYSMLFVGESGTGKSTAAKVIPYKVGIPFVIINFSTNAEEADLIGSMGPNVHKKDINDPEFVWFDGIITNAVRKGYCVVLEEINFSRAGVLGKLNSLLDENRQIDLPTGEIVKAHKNFRIIATGNIGYEGTLRLNKALVNRFQHIKIFHEPPKDEIAKIIMERTKYTNATNIDKVLRVYYAVQKYITEEQLDMVVSIRQLLNFFTQYKYYKTTEDAILNLMLYGVFLEEPEHLEKFKTTVLKVFDVNATIKM